MEALLKLRAIFPENFNAQFYIDVINGLQSEPKHLDAKYFYDAEGDKLFQQIMNCEEYYLTDCEMEIFRQQTAELSEVIMQGGQPFDLIELGAGDATKSTHLLRDLIKQEADFTYLPIDISSHVISTLNATLPLSVPGLKIKGLQGEYFEMLKKAADISTNRKVVLFMGANIGNMPVADAEDFCEELRRNLNPGDMVLIGFDLKKNPETILAAYNDSEGITKEFNLNLLRRINRELGANFNVDTFHHYAMYDPETGSCKSYLVSLKEQVVTFPDGEEIHFKRDEYIWMEISQKYSLDQTKEFALRSGFKPVANFFDSKGWFVDAVWVAE
ncbi:L-histidine N(alpha)-methyltransferase [Mucilaginibacter myungsuensis]|uniref:L-histidine N(Alpha)-methyltransferase n=1 Tax=Mucilaginibacter myungsuensis TaxID=649104 RepID=A0A929KUI0_9SPHI|nr:L-histidine N(alpha)-methyltransferase [Mucilaginibacter myungsuensis]MBE9661422.1 L-histidine N(alpha)-methyltransferase [Mucilaginibacter myungsuensis]MDN3597565.1 L-histidine N(alpha)-methyltransferase [Mucilaginibacter myungsuensis]